MIFKFTKAMEYIEINNITYGFAINFKHDQVLRASFNKLTEATFGFNFEKWYQNGFWSDNYIPYSLLQNNKVISNVSVSKIEFIIENEKKLGIQIGTVMTDKEYRNRGLNKFILEQVINEWKEQCDFIYLFANNSVLDFYPKFGFEKIEEYQCSKSLKISNKQSSLKKINIENIDDLDLLERIIKNSIPISKISMRNNESLIMFYCLSFKKNSICYLEKLDTITITDIEGDTLFINDVFSSESVNINDIIQLMSNETIKRVILGFTPIDDVDYEKSILKQEDTLFVIKDKVDYFKNNKWMFPVLSHA
jgi:GNAT superfamily N-acetyltransferase